MTICFSTDKHSCSVLHEIVDNFKDMGSRYDTLLEECETQISKAINQVMSEPSTASISDVSTSDSDWDDGIGEAVSKKEQQV